MTTLSSLLPVLLRATLVVAAVLLATPVALAGEGDAQLEAVLDELAGRPAAAAPPRAAAEAPAPQATPLPDELRPAREALLTAWRIVAPQLADFDPQVPLTRLRERLDDYQAFVKRVEAQALKAPALKPLPVNGTTPEPMPTTDTACATAHTPSEPEADAAELARRIEALERRVRKLEARPSTPSSDQIHEE